MKLNSKISKSFAALSVLLVSAFLIEPSSAQDERMAGTNPDTLGRDSNITYQQLDLFGEVFERARAQYVDEVDDETLIKYALNGMLESLDPHSAYLDEDDFKDMRVQTSGEFGGLGIEVTLENGLVKVVSPIDDTPAAKAGIQAGDLITHLNDEPVLGLTLSEAVDQMRGKVGSKIDLTLRREGVNEPIDVSIVRDIIKIKSVRSRMEGEDIGYIRVTTFSQNTSSGVKKALNSLQKEAGNKLTGYVLDLRNNPGGLLDQAIEVADIFLDKGEIVSTRGRDEGDSKRDNATKGDMAGGLPIVVLINGGSASASEIVSGALQDHRRAIVMGTQSFGKGSVQTVIPLPGNNAMRLTTARYYTPSGRSIQASGITPDIIVAPAKVEELAEIGLRESDLRGALKNPNGQPANDNTAADELKDDDAIENDEPVDYQLDRALDLLRGLSLYNQDRVPAETGEVAGDEKAVAEKNKDNKENPEVR